MDLTSSASVLNLGVAGNSQALHASASGFGTGFTGLGCLHDDNAWVDQVVGATLQVRERENILLYQWVSSNWAYRNRQYEIMAWREQAE